MAARSRYPHRERHRPLAAENPRARPLLERKAERRVARAMATARWLGRVRLGGRRLRTDALDRWLAFVATAIVAVAIALAMR